MFLVNRNSMHGCEMRKTYRGLETSPTNIFFLCGSDFPVAMKYNESPFYHISRACCPNPLLSLRTPTIKNCNGRGVAISLYFMRLLSFDKLRASCFTPRNDILGFHISGFDLSNTPSKFDIEKVTDKRKQGLLQDRKDK